MEIWNEEAKDVFGKQWRHQVTWARLTGGEVGDEAGEASWNQMVQILENNTEQFEIMIINETHGGKHQACVGTWSPTGVVVQKEQVRWTEGQLWVKV